MKITITILLILLFNWSYAYQVKTGSFKDIVFVSGDAAVNTVKIVGGGFENKTFTYTERVCYPLELQEITQGKIKTKVYKPTKDEKKAVKYVQNIKLDKFKMKFEIEVNGLHIVVSSNSQQSFTLIDNCTKLSPVGFVSGADQKFLGIDIYKGNIVRSNPAGSSDYEIVFGEIDDDGYHKALTIDPDLTIENTLKNLTDLQMATKIFENGPTCISVIKDPGNNEGFNVYAGKKYDFNISQPTFWEANSKYVGNVLCSDQPKAVIDCSGAELLIQHFIEISLGLNKEVRLEERKDNPDEQERYRKELEKAVVMGKKCDEAISKHEKETGKKIKLSPVYTEHFLKMKSSL